MSKRRLSLVGSGGGGHGPGNEEPSRDEAEQRHVGNPFKKPNWEEEVSDRPIARGNYKVK